MSFDFLKEGNDYSTMRVMVFFGGLPFMLCFTALWAWQSGWSGVLQEIPPSVYQYLLVLLGPKVAQKLVEVVGDVLTKKP